MAKSQTGKWVAKVASTGGSKTYRAQRPTNYYLLLVAILVIGLGSVFWARNHYHNATTAAASTVAPTIGTTSYSGLSIDVCGTIQPTLLPSASTTAAITALASGVLKVAPKTAAESGTNATLELFAKSYPGLVLTSNSLQTPKNATGSGQNVTNGQKCAAGTPDAGKTGTVLYTFWSSFASTKPQTSSSTSAFHLTANSLVTISFLPSGAKVPRPPATTSSAMLQAGQTSTTPTTAVNGSATTLPTISVPTTTAPTTTAPTTTTTKK